MIGGRILPKNVHIFSIFLAKPLEKMTVYCYNKQVGQHRNASFLAENRLHNSPVG